MAYAYSDYITMDDGVAKRTQLRLHIQEVSQGVTPDVAKGGSSRSSGQMAVYLQSLKDELRELNRTVKQLAGGNAYLVNLNNA
ncbi:hypothetical protein COB72_09300 [bacterium]|nr:MAG: hypothetical protein COB72_09300 [bacterium]